MHAKPSFVVSVRELSKGRNNLLIIVLSHRQDKIQHHHIPHQTVYYCKPNRPPALTDIHLCLNNSHHQYREPSKNLDCQGNYLKNDKMTKN